MLWDIQWDNFLTDRVLARRRARAAEATVGFNESISPDPTTNEPSDSSRIHFPPLIRETLLKQQWSRELALVTEAMPEFKVKLLKYEKEKEIMDTRKIFRGGSNSNECETNQENMPVEPSRPKIPVLLSDEALVRLSEIAARKTATARAEHRMVEQMKEKQRKVVLEQMQKG
jgi:hypothetical protein